MDLDLSSLKGSKRRKPKQASGTSQAETVSDSEDQPLIERKKDGAK